MITILCTGSRGDFQPYIALAQELKKRHFPVRIAGGNEFQPFVEGYGIEYFPLHANLEELDIDPKMLEAAATSDNPLKMLLTFNKMKAYGVYMVQGYYDACQNSDLIIYHPGAAIGYFAAKQMGIPAIQAAPFPMHKTKERLSVVMYGKSKSNPLNIALSYSLIQGMLWMASKSSIKQFWKNKFNTLPKPFQSPFQNLSEEYPAIISCSNHVFARPADWSEHIHQHGYWFVEENSYTPPIELKAFLDAGEKPIYIGFGSMAKYHDGQDMIRAAIAAVQKSGKRAIVSGADAISPLPDTIFPVGSIPHSWLFSQVSAVCHHGGAGTTAAGFKAGIPSIIVPFSNDQFAWAHRAYDLGVGTYPIYQKIFSETLFSEALEQVDNPSIIKKAQELGKLITSEKGTEHCVDIIENVIKTYC